jgi:DMSO/TMAO reductase YedYZ molybdopterin-dependent catalytic subunit
VKKKIGLHQLYRENPEKADQLLWGRTHGSPSRRGFLKKSALAAMSMALGAEMVFANHFPEGMIPAGLAFSEEEFQLPGKHPGLVVLNDKPINAETPAHLLDDHVTPGNLFFVRNNGIPPKKEDINVEQWTLTIEGESAKTKKTYTLAELKSKFKNYTYHLTLECGGNGRKEFNPPAKGNQWSTGAVGCAAFTGVRLKDVLNDVGIKSDAVYIGYYGEDTHLSGDPNKDPISRGVPIEKAMEMHSLIAWSMNGEDLPYLNGYPLRLVFGGWPASTSGKWLSKIVIRNKEHDGTKMKGQAYRIPCTPVAPGTKVADEDMCIIESMPVKSLITYPKSGATIRLDQELPIRGHAWAGESRIDGMQYSIDFGASWKNCMLASPVNKYAWQHFDAKIKFPKEGYYEVWARAKDVYGKWQPMILPGWNPKGYLNNACHRIAVKIVS